MRKRKSLLVVMGMAVCMFCLPDTSTAEVDEKIYVVNEPIQQDGVQMRVLFAQKEGDRFTQTFNKSFQAITVDKPGHDLLRVRIFMKRPAGKPIGKGFLVKAYIKDKKNNLYPYWMAGPPGLYIDVTQEEARIIDTPVEESESQIDYIFTVPKGTKIVAFQWDDLPTVRLYVD